MRPEVYKAAMATYKIGEDISTEDWDSSESECDIEYYEPFEHLDELENIPSEGSEQGEYDPTGQNVNWADWDEYEGDNESDNELTPIIQEPGWKKNMQSIQNYQCVGDDELYWKMREFIELYFKYEIERDMIKAALIKLWYVQEFRCWMTTKVYMKNWQIDLYMFGGSDTLCECELKYASTALEEFMVRLSNYMTEGILYMRHIVTYCPTGCEKQNPEHNPRVMQENWTWTSQELLTEVTLMLHDFIRQGKI